MLLLLLLQIPFQDDKFLSHLRAPALRGAAKDVYEVSGSLNEVLGSKRLGEKEHTEADRQTGRQTDGHMFAAAGV